VRAVEQEHAVLPALRIDEVLHLAGYVDELFAFRGSYGKGMHGVFLLPAFLAIPVWSVWSGGP
jgi:hypothetical protein